MTIDQDELIEAVLVLNVVEKPARADTVGIELGPFAEDGGYRDVNVVADDLAELESLGKLKRAPAIDWNDSGPTPKTRIRYVLPREQ